MTTDREFESFVHSWLKEGGDALSERVAAGVMADLATTAQRRALPPISRWRSLPTPTRFALASSAAVIVIAAVGAGILLARPGPNVGPTVPTLPVSPSPSAVSSPSDGSSPSPSKEAPSDDPSATSRGRWEAIDGLRITFDLPAGWSQPGGTGSSDVYPTPHVSGQKSDLAVNFYDDIETVLQDPCPSPYRQGGGTGTTPAHLAARLRSATGYSATEPFDDTLAGYQGKRLTLQIPDSLDDCHYPPGLLLWIGRPTGFGSPSQRSTLWILDVDGKRVMIEAVSFPGTSPQDLAAQQQLIDSIRIEQVKPAPTTPATKQGFIESIDGLRIRLELPAGWEQSVEDGAPSLAGPGAAASVDFFVDITDVRSNPCRRVEPGGAVPGSTSDDLARILRSAKVYSATVPDDVELGGHLGRRMTLHMPSAFDDCGPYEVRRLWKASPHDLVPLPGARHDLWILDVDDIRLVIDAQSAPETPAESIADQRRLVDSIQIERVATAAHPLPAPRPEVVVDAIDGLRITYALPRDWAHGSTLASSISSNPAAPSVTFGTVDRVPRYPCTMPGFGSGPGQDATVDQLVLAFEQVTEYQHTPPTGVAVAGFDGQRIDLIMPQESAEPDCVRSTLEIWSSGDAPTRGLRGQRHELRILDVDGVLLVVDATSSPGTAAGDLVAQQALIDSIRIERTAP